MSHPFVGIGSNNHMMMFLADFECGAFISQGWAILEPECYKSRAPAAPGRPGRADAPPAFPLRVLPVSCPLSSCFSFLLCRRW